MFLENDRNYSSPRILDQLHRKEFMLCSENRVARGMRCHGIIAIQRRKFRVTTNSRHDHPVWTNVLNRNFVAKKPNAAWVSDITYVWTFEGWLYAVNGARFVLARYREFDDG